jgi:hypothetical protein
MGLPELITAVGTISLAAVTYLTVREMQQQQKLSKLEREMSLVVGPLYSKKANEILFGITSYPPNRHGPDSDYRWSYYYSFWDDIITNMHLTPDYLRLRLNEYLTAKDAYWNALDGENSSTTIENTPLGQIKRETFDLKRRDLNSTVKARYYSLTEEIDRPRFKDRVSRRLGPLLENQKW